MQKRTVPSSTFHRSQKLFWLPQVLSYFCASKSQPKIHRRVAQFQFNLHTHSEHYFYLPDSALIYDFIVAQKKFEKYNEEKKGEVRQLQKTQIEMQTWPVDGLTKLPRVGAVGGRIRCGASTCVCHSVCHNSKLKLCCLPIAIASRVFIWLPRFMPSACYELSRCR